MATPTIGTGDAIRSGNLPTPIVRSAPVDGETSSGNETIVGTITIPPQPVITEQIPTCHVVTSSSGASSGDRFRVRVRDDDLDGEVRGSNVQEVGTGERRWTFNLVWPEKRLVPPGHSATFIVTLQRIVGSADIGTLTPVSTMTVLVLRV